MPEEVTGKMPEVTSRGSINRVWSKPVGETGSPPAPLQNGGEPGPPLQKGGRGFRGYSRFT